ncbi:MAG: TIGR02444 family protein [Halioglobus sp.]
MDNLFWEYSCAGYAKEGVAALCLALQDEFGMDVNVLLYGAWLGNMGVEASQAHLSAIDEHVLQWRQDIVLPLRALRRDMKGLPAGEASYEELKALELSAEQQQQELMYSYYSAHKHSLTSIAPRAANTQWENLRLSALIYSRDEANWNDKVQRLSHYLAA